MSTQGASNRSRLLPSLLGVVLLLMGLALVAGGIKLATVGGSLYYLIAGVGIALTGILLLLGKPAALWLYAWYCSPARSGRWSKSAWTGGVWCRVWHCGSCSAS